MPMIVPLIAAGVSATGSIIGGAMAKKGNKQPAQPAAPPTPPVQDLSLASANNPYQAALTRNGVFRQGDFGSGYKTGEQVQPTKGKGVYGIPGSGPGRWLNDEQTTSASSPQFADMIARLTSSGGGGAPSAFQLPQAMDAGAPVGALQLPQRMADFQLPQQLGGFNAAQISLADLILPGRTSPLAASPQSGADRAGIEALISRITAQGGQTNGQGLRSVAGASDFYNRLLGNRSQQVAAVGGDIEGINDSAFQQRQLAAGGVRGGGRNSQLQQLGGLESRAINERLQAVRPMAAEGAASAGNQLAQLVGAGRAQTGQELAAALSGLTNLRGQDLQTLLAGQSQLTTERGQDISALLQGRGQNLEAASINAGSQIRGRELEQSLYGTNLQALLQGHGQDLSAQESELQALLQGRGQDITQRGQTLDSLSDNRRMDIDQLLSQRGQTLQERLAQQQLEEQRRGSRDQLIGNIGGAAGNILGALIGAKYGKK